MKSLIIAAILSATTLIAPAARSEGTVCSEMGLFAEDIMKGRQNGQQLSTLMQALDTMGEGPVVTFVKTIALDAFEVSRFSTPKYQQSAIIDFRAKWELACYSNTMGSN